MIQNLIHSLPNALTSEVFETLLLGEGVRIERIVSHGQASEEGFWYDQDEAEWILLLKGAACLAFDDGSTIDLQPGDSLTIRAHRRHRVQWTKLDEPTVWLAVFYRQEISVGGLPRDLVSDEATVHGENCAGEEAR